MMRPQWGILPLAGLAEVGWAAGLHEQEDIYFQMERAAGLMLRGMEAT